MERDPARSFLHLGPFERFISAAITTMFAIVLAWRILLERDEEIEQAAEKKVENGRELNVTQKRPPLPIVLCTNEFEETDEIDDERNYKPPYSFLYSDSETSDEHLDTITEEGTDDYNSSGDSMRLERIREMNSRLGKALTPNAKVEAVTESKEITTNSISGDSLHLLGFHTQEQPSENESFICDAAIKTIQSNCSTPSGEEVITNYEYPETSLLEFKRVLEHECDVIEQSNDSLLTENNSQIEMDALKSHVEETKEFISLSENLRKPFIRDGANNNCLKVRDEMIQFNKKNTELTGVSKKLRQLLAREAARKYCSYRDSNLSNAIDEMQVKVIPISAYIGTHYHSFKRYVNNNDHKIITVQNNNEALTVNKDTPNSSAKDNQNNDSYLLYTDCHACSDKITEVQKNTDILNKSVKVINANENVYNFQDQTREMETNSPLLINLSMITDLSSPSCGKHLLDVHNSCFNPNNNTQSSEITNTFLKQDSCDYLEENCQTKLSEEIKIDNIITNKLEINNTPADTTNFSHDMFLRDRVTSCDLSNDLQPDILKTLLEKKKEIKIILKKTSPANHTPNDLLTKDEKSRDCDESLSSEIRQNKVENLDNLIPKMESLANNSHSPPLTEISTNIFLSKALPDNTWTGDQNLSELANKENESLLNALKINSDMTLLKIKQNSDKSTLFLNHERNKNFNTGEQSNKKTSFEPENLSLNNYVSVPNVTQIINLPSDGKIENFNEDLSIIKLMPKNVISDEINTLLYEEACKEHETTTKIPEMSRISKEARSRVLSDVYTSVSFNSTSAKNEDNSDRNNFEKNITDGKLKSNNESSFSTEKEFYKTQNKMIISQLGKEPDKMIQNGDHHVAVLKQTSDGIQKWQSVENELEKLNNQSYSQKSKQAALSMRSEFFNSSLERRKTDALLEKFKAKARNPDINIAPSIPDIKNVIGKSNNSKYNRENNGLKVVTTSVNSRIPAYKPKFYGFERNQQIMDQWTSILSSTNLTKADIEKNNAYLKPEKKLLSENMESITTHLGTVSKVSASDSISKNLMHQNSQDLAKVRSWTVTLGKRPSVENIEEFLTARRSSSGYVETDLDTGTKTQIVFQETNLDDIITSKFSVDRSKTRSLLNLAPNKKDPKHAEKKQDPQSRTKSLDYLLDEDGKKTIQPPENELKKSYDLDRQLSSPERKFKKSLDKLNVPEWFKNSKWNNQDPSGFILNGSRPDISHKYPYLNAKSASASMLNNNHGNNQSKVIIPRRISVDWSKIKGQNSPTKFNNSSSITSTEANHFSVKSNAEIKPYLPTKEYTVTWNKVDFEVKNLSKQHEIKEYEMVFPPKISTCQSINEQIQSNVLPINSVNNQVEKENKKDSCEIQQSLSIKPKIKKTTYSSPPLETDLDAVLNEKITNSENKFIIKKQPLETDLDAVLDDIPNYNFANLSSLEKKCSALFSSNLSPVKNFSNKHPLNNFDSSFSNSVSVPSQNTLRLPTETSMTENGFRSASVAFGSSGSLSRPYRSAANSTYV